MLTHNFYPPEKNGKNTIKVLAILDNFDNFFLSFLKIKKNDGGYPRIFLLHFSSNQVQRTLHAKNQDPRSSPSLRKVIRRRREKKERLKKTINSVATTFTMQPVCNAARAAHALRSDQYFHQALLCFCVFNPK